MFELKAGVYKHSLMQPGECYYVVERIGYEKAERVLKKYNINVDLYGNNEEEEN